MSQIAVAEKVDEAKGDGFFIRMNKKASYWLDEQAKQVDLYLTGKSLTQERNKTQANIIIDNVWSEGGEFSSALNFELSLRLPNLEKKYQLLFSNYNKSKENRSVTARTGGVSSRNYGASVGFFGKMGDIKTSFQPRVELSSPLKTFHTLAFETEAFVAEQKLDLRLELFADAEKGTGEFLSVAHEYPLTEIYNITTVFEEEYQENENLFTTLHAFILDRKLRKRESVEVGHYFASKSRPNFHLDSYIVSIGYHREPYRKVFSYHIALSQNFLKENSFKGKTSLSLSLDFIF